MSSFSYFNPFHLVEFSPWPILAASSVFTLALSLIYLFYFKSPVFLFITIAMLLFTSFQWWRDMIRESSFMGFHTSFVLKGLRIGMILFILSEVMFFISFFWTFFHSSLSPVPELGCIWPPIGIKALNPYQLPLLNTIVLLASGVTVTYCHHSLINKNLNSSKLSLTLTITLGIYFTFLQLGEYMETSFSIADSIFGSIFFVATGFHGIHVIVGSIFLGFCFFRFLKNQFSSNHHFGFEAASWYWHFVDVVWIFLYCNIYVWGA